MSRLRIVGYWTVIALALTLPTAIVVDDASGACRTTYTTLTKREWVQVDGEVVLRVYRDKVPTQDCDPAPSEPQPRTKNYAAGSSEKAMRRYEAALEDFQACQGRLTDPTAPACELPTRPALPERATVDGQIGSVPAPQISPQTAAYMALAELRLVAPKPGIGPSPKLNPWKIAAVGYPYWLWADGNTDPAPVSDTVADLTVSLDPRVQKVVFQMGDGKSVTCRGTGTAWHRGVEPGSPSPTCGYRWTTPAPKKTYTVTAKTYWAIDWSAAGQAGTITLVQDASTAIPVGELQVVVR